MSSPKSHHFVPRWYLEYFTNPKTGKLHVYDRHTDQYRQQKPKEVMIINRYYRQEWAREGQDPNELEKRSSVIENLAKHALERLIISPTDLVSEETAAIVFFLEFQRIRVPRQAALARNMLKLSLLQFDLQDAVSSVIDDRKGIARPLRFALMKQMTGCISPWLMEMQWDVLEASEKSDFITMDSPVSLFNVNFPPPFEAGIGLAGTRVLFPLSPRRMLVIRHPDATGAAENPSRRLSPPKNEDCGISVTFYPEIDGVIVDAYNRTMVQLSDRIVVGQSKDALDRCIAEEP